MRRQGRLLGADLVGIAPAVLPPAMPGGPQAYRKWVASGLHGEMGYMARSPAGRAEITRWFPAAKSVFLAAFGYHDGSRREGNDPGLGRLARFSLPPDYRVPTGVSRPLARLLYCLTNIAGFAAIYT